MPERRPFNALEHGIFKRFLIAEGKGDGDVGIDAGRWNRARAERTSVGTCRRDGGDMIPVANHEAGNVTWYGAQCQTCALEIAAPNGELLRRSARHDEMPPGFWSKRTKAQKQVQGG